MRSRTSKAVLVMLAAAVPLASSCSMVFKQPEVRFDGIEVSAIGMRGGTVLARFEVYNPNGYVLEADAIRYDLELSDGNPDAPQWVKIASGTYDERVRVDAGSAAFVEVPIAFAFADLAGALRSVLDRGSVDYRVSGDVRVSEPVSRTVPYRRTGTVDVLDSD